MGKRVKKPKGPRSAYTYFVKDYLQFLKRTHGPLSFGEYSRRCAARWKRLPHEVKSKYRKMSERDAFRYKKEMESLSPKDLRRLRRRKKDPEAPLRPMTAYVWFCQRKWRQVAHENPDLTYKQVLKRLAHMWAKTSHEAKQKYERMAECDRKCYQREKEKYRKQSKRKIEI